jgi:hypothetical protein
MRAWSKPPLRRAPIVVATLSRRPPAVIAYWTPVMTSVVAPVLAAPWQPRQRSSSVAWLRRYSPLAVWALWQPAQLSAVSVLTPELMSLTCGPPSAATGIAARNSQAPSSNVAPAADLAAADRATVMGIFTLLGRIGGSSMR